MVRPGTSTTPPVTTLAYSPSACTPTTVSVRFQRMNPPRARARRFPLPEALATLNPLGRSLSGAGEAPMMRLVPRDEARRVRPVARRTPLRAGPFLFLILLALPSANYQRFDGLPLSRAPEFLVLALLIPLLASRGLRRLPRRGIARWPPRLRAALTVVAMVALAAKLLLLASGTYEGFLACYRSTLEPPAAGACERSF